MKARKTASFGVAYNYSQIAYPAREMPHVLSRLCEQLARRLGFTVDNGLLNYYPDQSASMGFHSDETAFLTPGTGVAIISLGIARPIVFRSKADRAAEFSYLLPGGSLLYMSQEMQADWLHAIPKSADQGERISLTFRSMQVLTSPG